MNYDRKAFTLVELLVVIAIIGILIALLLPAVQAARVAARRTQCRNQLKQIGIALHNYHSARKVLPGGAAYDGDAVSRWLPGGNWVILAMPYMEERGIYDSIDHKARLMDVVNRNAVKQVVNGLICPADPDASQPLLKGRNFGAGHPSPDVQPGLWYAGCTGPTHDGNLMTDGCPYCPDRTPSNSNFCCQGFNIGTWGSPNGSIAQHSFAGMFGRCPKGIRFQKVSDGLSHTLMVGESLPTECLLLSLYTQNFPVTGTLIPLNTFVTMGPTATFQQACGFKSRHPGGVHFAMGDGSVHFVEENINFRIYNNLGSRAGNEAVALP